jgi:SagB-type dehydrogenase family enzyme
MDRRSKRIRTAAWAVRVVGAWLLAAMAAEAADVITLPGPRQSGGMPLLTALKGRRSGRDFDPTPLPRQVVGDLLWAAFGENRPEEGKRTAPSSFNWQDVTIYVFTAEGVWSYNAPKHQLDPVHAGDHRAKAGMQEYVATAPLSLVYVSDFAKMVWNNMKIPERDKLIVGSVDTGHISQNVYLFGASEGLTVVARGSVDREALKSFLGLTEQQHVIIGQTVGYPAKRDKQEGKR